MTDQEKLSRIQLDESLFTSIYEEHRQYSLNFMRKINSDEDLILDIYQDAIIVLYEKSKKQDFVLTCSIQTYLNSICRNQLLKKYRDSSIFLTAADEFLPDITDWHDDENEKINEDQVSALQKALNKLKTVSSKCYDILHRFFYCKQSMSEIAESLGYTNADNVKNQKARCQKKLKELTREI
jgi:RNA polymerase sigma factor (sigma-70 family)